MNNIGELQAFVLNWKRKEEIRIRDDFQRGVYGRRSSVAKRDVALITFTARLWYDRLEAKRTELQELERNLIEDLRRCSGESVLRPPGAPVGKSGEEAHT